MGHKAVFLDRDNTLIEDPGYINHPNQVRLLPGAAAALAQLRKLGYLLVIVSNQSGIARGIVTEEVLEKIHQRITRLLTDEGAMLDAIYYCPYHPEGVIPKYRMESDLRKPAPGMLLKAAEELDIDLGRSWMVGDSYRDIAAGKRAGCRTILIDSPVNRAARTATDPIPDRKVGSIREAANVIRMLDQAPAQEPTPPTPEPADEEPPMTTETEVTIIEKNLLFNEEPGEKLMKPAAAVEERRAPQAACEPEFEPEAQETPVEQETPIEPELPAEPELSAGMRPQPAGEEEHKTNAILREMLHLLKSRHRQDLYEEFSLARFLAMMVQTVALFCLVVSLWFWLDTDRPDTSAQLVLGYAVVMQLMVIALLLIRKNR